DLGHRQLADGALGGHRQALDAALDLARLAVQQDVAAKNKKTDQEFHFGLGFLLIPARAGAWWAGDNSRHKLTVCHILAEANGLNQPTNAGDFWILRVASRLSKVTYCDRHGRWASRQVSAARR